MEHDGLMGDCLKSRETIENLADPQHYSHSRAHILSYIQAATLSNYNSLLLETELHSLNLKPSATLKTVNI